MEQELNPMYFDAVRPHVGTTLLAHKIFMGLGISQLQSQMAYKKL
jgi:hypothetical protein